MRTRYFVMGAALLLIAAGARAQEQLASADTPQQDVPKSAVPAALPDVPLSNQIDFGIRGTIFGADSDQARFQRYRDLRDGGTLDVFRFTKETSAYRFNMQADHIGYRDQRYSATYNDFGKVKATFEWNQTPLFYSDSTRTLYSAASAGTLVLPQAVQSGIQNKTLSLVDAVGNASLFTTQSKRDVADFKLIYSATGNVDLNFTFKNTQRQGSQPYGAGFGFSDAIEVPLPVDHRTSELGAALQWANDRGLAKVGYDGSFFRNDIATLTWDNPLRISDSATAGPELGRMALWPNSNRNTFSGMGAINVPGHSRATAFVAVSNLTQNDPLIPFTSNGALAAIALDRATADLKARAISMNYNFTTRPTSFLWFSARYRLNQFDNRSTEFNVGQTVNYDTAVATLNEATDLIGYTKHTLDGDASITPFKFVAFRGGFTREQIDHANPSTGVVTRMVEKTVEDTGRVSADLTGIGWLTLRGVFEHSKRVGSGLDLEDFIQIGEQPSLRQFDIADRNKDSFRGIIQVMPVSQFSVNASAGIGREEYPGANFGLRNNDNHVYSIGFDFVPLDAVSFGVSYGYEKYTALQASRTANPLPAITDQYLNDPTLQFNDPRRDWTDNSSDNVRTWNASLDLLKIIPKTDIRVGYDYSKADSLYVYGLGADTVIAAPVQLPAVTNKLQRGTADVKYFLTRHLAAGLVYWFDKYDVNDFALGPRASLASPATASSTLMLLGNYYRPYSANTFWGKLSYLW